MSFPPAGTVERLSSRGRCRVCLFRHARLNQKLFASLEVLRQRHNESRKASGLVARHISRNDNLG